jgi:transcriptional regulator of heat shock response
MTRAKRKAQANIAKLLSPAQQRGRALEEYEELVSHFSPLVASIAQTRVLLTSKQLALLIIGSTDDEVEKQAAVKAVKKLTREILPYIVSSTEAPDHGADT